VHINISGKSAVHPLRLRSGQASTGSGRAGWGLKAEHFHLVLSPSTTLRTGLSKHEDGRLYTTSQNFVRHPCNRTTRVTSYPWHTKIHILNRTTQHWHRCSRPESPFLSPELKLRATAQRRLKPAFSPLQGASLCSPATLAPGEGADQVVLECTNLLWSDLALDSGRVEELAGWPSTSSTGRLHTSRLTAFLARSAPGR
jgi:hypothetical protein